MLLTNEITVAGKTIEVLAGLDTVFGLSSVMMWSYAKPAEFAAKQVQGKGYQARVVRDGDYYFVQVGERTQQANKWVRV